MSFIKEFKEFAMKGNVVDMAVGIIIGAGFGKIVSSLVADIIMPPLGILIGGVDFNGLKLTLLEGVNGSKPVTLNYGAFIQTVFDFTIVAFSIFLLIKTMNRMKKKSEDAAPAAPPREEVLLTEIRDILRSK